MTATKPKHPGLVHGYGKANPNWRGGPDERTCPTCGKSFFPVKRSDKKRFCSLKCRPRTSIEKLSEMGRIAGAMKSAKAKAIRESRISYIQEMMPSAMRIWHVQKTPSIKIYSCKCKHCGVEFEWPSKRETCKDCRYKFTQKRRVLTKVPNLKCDHCDVAFHRYGKKTRWDRVFCSYKCHLDNGGARRAGDASTVAKRRYGAKKDANHNEIVDVFEKLGAQVLDMSSMGCGIPDLLVWCFGQWRLVDVKNPKTPYGRRGLNTRQREWALSWKGGPVYMVSTVDQAIAMVNGKLDDIPKFGGG